MHVWDVPADAALHAGTEHFCGCGAFMQVRPNYYKHDWSAYPKTPEESPAEAVLKNGKYTLVVK